jgi:hypothetical protein
MMFLLAFERPFYLFDIAFQKPALERITRLRRALRGAGMLMDTLVRRLFRS